MLIDSIVEHQALSYCNSDKKWKILYFWGLKFLSMPPSWSQSSCINFVE